MQVISVINYKGGVGKTTLTANIGAELAWRGYRVLLVDMDAQASLTFSFIRPEEWVKDLAANRTIKEWYGSFHAGSPRDLAALRYRPKKVQQELSQSGAHGVLDLIPSHLELINVDLELATELAGGTLRQAKLNYLRVHRRLAEGLAQPGFQDVDVVLIDCPPNFNIVTKTAIVASDHILVPAKPDSLSTMGIDYLQRSLTELVANYNEYAELETGGDPQPKINPQIVGVVFTMVQVYGGQPVSAQRPYIQQTRSLGLHVFDQWLRENKTIYGPSATEGVPVALKGQSYFETVMREIENLVDQLISRVGLNP